jgi:L-glyceraldehyde 3-phosphate reductase
VLLPVISLGLWHNFGHDRPFTTQQAICRRAFDLGVTHRRTRRRYATDADINLWAASSPQ